MSHRAKYIVFFLAGILFGAAPLYFLTKPSEKADEFQAYVSTEKPPPAAEAPPIPEGTADDLRQCRETLSMVRDAHEQALKNFSENEELVEHLTDLVKRTSPDTPIAFPEQLDEAFQPENFEKTVAELMKRCPDLFTERTRVDCSEYPCVIEFPVPPEIEGGASGLNVREHCPDVTELIRSPRTQQMATNTGTEQWIQYAPFGSGIGLGDYLNENQLRHWTRLQHRWRILESELVRENYEDACLLEQDIEACRSLARAFHRDLVERETYYQVGCDAGDASSCHWLAYHRCVSSGRCDANAEHFARRAIQQDPDRHSYHSTLATILCARGQTAQANASWQQACRLGDSESCDRTC